MLKRISVLLMLVLFLFTITVQAQEDEGRKGKDKDDEEEFFWDRWGKSKWFNWKLHGNPFIELNYGLSQIKHNSMDIKFNDIGKT